MALARTKDCDERDADRASATVSCRGWHGRNGSKGPVVRLSPMEEVFLTGEMDLVFVEEQRRFQIAKARRWG